jgi:TIR domain-containing protein
MLAVTQFDLFVSYRRKDGGRVLPLVEALRSRGLSVWFDHDEIDDFAAITDGIRAGLAASKALLAWYSADYPPSRPCQMELTAAFLAAQHEGDPRRRVLAINPETSAAHVEPVELRDEQHPPAPTDRAGYDALAARVAAHVQTLATPLGAILPAMPPRQYGLKLAGASRFVGRTCDLWRLHSALHGAESAIITGTTASGLAQVQGMGGRREVAACRGVRPALRSRLSGGHVLAAGAGERRRAAGTRTGTPGGGPQRAVPHAGRRPGDRGRRPHPASGGGRPGGDTRAGGAAVSLGGGRSSLRPRRGGRAGLARPPSARQDARHDAQSRVRKHRHAAAPGCPGARRGVPPALRASKVSARGGD